MNFDELSKVLTDEGLNICPICGTPFEKYHSRQKTCGSEDCKRAYHNRYLKERRERLIAEDRDGYNIIHAEANRKYRNKKRNAEIADKNLELMQEHWQNQLKIKNAVDEEDGIYYGKRQMEKTLAMIPKIDTNIGGAKYDNVHGQDDAERG